MNVRSITSFTADNDTDLLRAGVKWLRETPGATLVLEGREYLIEDEFSHQLMLDTMNGKYGVNPEPIVFNRNFPYTIGLDFDGAENVTLDGNGAKILVNGFMETVSVHHCKGVTLKNLTFDHERRPFSRGYIIGGGRIGSLDDGGYQDYWGDIFFPNQKYITAVMAAERCVVHDPKTQRYIPVDARGEKKELIAPNTIRIHDFDLKDFVGYEVLVWHSYHYRPTILVWEAKDTVIEDVKIHSNNGMGVVGHRSENILMRRLAVVPAPGEVMSTNGDATHFPSCKGTIRFESCIFEGQGDDSTNVHTYYHTIFDVEKNVCKITMQAPTGTHSQKADHPDPGDDVFLCDDVNLCPREFFKVLEVEDLGDWVYKLTLDRDLPEDDYTQGNRYFADYTQQPRVEMVGCRIRNHLARGILIKTRNVLIEGCMLDSNTGNSIRVCAEGWWHEGTHSSNVTIRNNTIIRREKHDFGSYFGNAGGISVNIDGKGPDRPVHENITIENNVVSCPDTKHAILVSYTKGVKIRNNKLYCQLPEHAIITQVCEDVEIENNEIM